MLSSRHASCTNPPPPVVDLQGPLWKQTARVQDMLSILACFGLWCLVLSLSAPLGLVTEWLWYTRKDKIKKIHRSELWVEE
ncbi:hypothetical protein BCR43DRAFT_520205 [Syncephalastrum racemosum]|uniref:Uncharacterized protein n=1 Tax=Syncephalastrum racemosum TaxID=13706 RepID=A0A1X2HTQ7_SYNRA|nr:hypothetical protein BCR43DRAFT_520205 [Syncephalastrum racemosum]